MEVDEFVEGLRSDEGAVMAAAKMDQVRRHASRAGAGIPMTTTMIDLDGGSGGFLDIHEVVAPLQAVLIRIMARATLMGGAD